MIRPKPDTKGDDLDSLIQRTGSQPGDQVSPPAAPQEPAKEKESEGGPEPSRAATVKKTSAVLKPNKSFLVSIPYDDWFLARRCAGMIGITLHDYILEAVVQRNVVDGKPLKKLQ